nr:hypothetical protein [Tanacetum cinerariifolium]
MELKKILIDKMEGNKSIQRSDEQRNLYKRRREDDDQEGPSAGSDRGSKRRREGGEHASASTPSEPATGSAGRSTIRTQSRQMSASESAFAEEPVQTTCQIEEPSHPVFETGAEDPPIVQTSQHPEWFSQPRRQPTPDRDWNKSLPAAQGNAQSWISALAKKTDARSSFNELLETPIDFSNFIMNRLGVDTLTPELLAGLTYELMRGSSPKPKASVRKKKGGSASSTTPPTPITTLTPTTTVVAVPRLSAAAKGKQPARATTPTEPTDVERTEAEQLKISDAQQESSSTSSFKTNLLNPLIDPDRVKFLEDNFSNISGIVNQYIHQQIPEAVREAVQTQINRLQDSIQRENDEFLKTIDENMKKIIKEQVKTQVKAQVTRILPRIKKAMNAQLEAEILIDKMEGNKSIQRSEEQRNLYKALVEAYDADKTILDTYRESTILKRRREDDDQKETSAGLDRGSKRRRERGEHASASTSSELAIGGAGRSTTGSQSRQLSASESAFVEEPVQTTYRKWNKTLPAAQGNAQLWINELARQTDACSSFNELLDTPIDVSNFIMNRLGVETLTPELLAGPTYELMRGSCSSLTELEYHLEEPLPLIPDNRGRRVIPFEHFINNNLEYLRGGTSSRKYTTSVTKTKAADYGHIKWIEDLVPRTMWIQESINYDKHAFWGVSQWGQKRQQFYGFAVNWESALDVYSKRRIIARHVEDLQLVVESYQKRLNLTKPDTYRSDLKRREAYTAYSNPKGFIYQIRDKKNRLMRIDELHKFSDGTPNDVRNALDDRLKGIRMQYLPTTIWRKGDKDRTTAMIQAIDKMLKTRRIMRSLERFVGGRQYEGDF